jgi:hypothetical protein
MIETLLRTSNPYDLHDHDTIFSEPGTRYVLRVKDLPDDERPRERLLELGPAHLTS